MALVMSPMCFGRGGGPLSFTKLVILQVPQEQICGWSAPRTCHPVANVTVESVETPNEQVIKVALPGLKKEDIQIQIQDDRTLHISVGHSKQEMKEGDDDEAMTSQHEDHRDAIRIRFARKFRLPEDADADQINAGFDNSMLTVNIPKRKLLSPQARRIEVDGGESN